MDAFLENNDETLCKNEYCGNNCAFYKGCYANSELCIKRVFEEILNTIAPREAYVVKKIYGYDGYVCSKQELATDLEIDCERIEQIEAKALRKLRHPSRSKKLKKYFFDIYCTGENFYSRLLTGIFGEADDETKAEIKLGIDFSIVYKEKCLLKSPADVKKELNKRIDEIQEFFPYAEEIRNLNILTFDHLIHTPQSRLLSFVFGDNDAEFLQFARQIESMGYRFKDRDFNLENALAEKVAQIIKDGSLFDETIEDLSIKTTIKLLKYDICTYEDLLRRISFVLTCDEFTQEETDAIQKTLLSKGFVYKSDNSESIYLTNKFIEDFCVSFVQWMIEHKQSIFRLTENLKVKNLNMLQAIYYIKSIYQDFEFPTRIFSIDSTIEELELSVRSYNCLKRAEINTVEQLLELTDDDLMKVRNLGQKGVNEIKEILSKI